MSRWRIGLVLILAAVPLLFLTALGAYFLWERHWHFWAWWLISLFWATAYGLAWYWQRKHRLLRPPDFSSPLHWTERDQQAWRLVEERAKNAGSIDPESLVGIQIYVDTAKEMALELAGAYHPGAKDPVSQLTIPEILAVVELAAHDMAELVDRYLPGGHLLTLKNWRQAKQATDWYRAASNVYWLVSGVFSPVQTGMRYAANQLGTTLPWQRLQQNLLLWFYTAYVHRLGTYLIDLNSGRLRVGAWRYRELLAERTGGGRAAATEKEAADQVRQVVITTMGQVKMGKSSLINAILGEQRAHTDVLPATDRITRYELQPEGVPTRFVLLDTIGYGHEGPRQDQLQATREAAQQSDLVLLVLHARNPGRQADLEILQALQRWFTANPDLRLPPILAVLTHIDLLSPAMEWSPPYDWQHPTRPKAEEIRQAVNAVREQLGDYLAGCVPVCVAPGKVYGIEEWFLPTVVELLDEAHAVALLRCLRAEADAGKIRKVFRQLLAAGTELFRQAWQSKRP
jgi:predicted GTPase